MSSRGLVSSLPWVACSALALACTTKEPDALGTGSGAAGADPVSTLAGGDPSRFELVSLFASGTLSATDLAFNPAHEGEVWAVLRESAYDGVPCTDPDNPAAPVPYDPEACALLEGSVAVIERATHADPIVHVLKDANAWHFMRRPTGIAFADNDEFATSAEARTGNWEDDPVDFIGPTLWSADPAIFGPNGPGGNGSHLDMLHASPFAMGIEHEKDRVYWVVNGQAGAVDRYDFGEPHVPGGSDHSDGTATRFVLGELERVPEVPSHLAMSGKDLYVADTGHGRVIRFDTTSGTPGEPLPAADDQLGGQVGQVVGATVDVVVPPGVLGAPSGVAVSGSTLFVTDNATGVVAAFDLDGNEIVALDTGVPPGMLAGIEVGPDGRAYVALLSGEVARIDPR